MSSWLPIEWRYLVLWLLWCLWRFQPILYQFLVDLHHSNLPGICQRWTTDMETKNMFYYHSRPLFQTNIGIFTGVFHRLVPTTGADNSMQSSLVIRFGNCHVPLKLPHGLVFGLLQHIHTTKCFENIIIISFQG